MSLVTGLLFCVVTAIVFYWVVRLYLDFSRPWNNARSLQDFNQPQPNPRDGT
jgi:hypothetical protein